METEVLKSLGEEKMRSELQKHISECQICQDLSLVQGWMNRFKESTQKTDMPKKILPAAESLWNHVYGRKRPDKKMVRKALRPLIIPQVLFYSLLLTGIIAMTIWGFKKLGNTLDSRMISQILPFFGIMMFIVVISLSFCAIVVAFDKRKHPV